MYFDENPTPTRISEFEIQTNWKKQCEYYNYQLFISYHASFKQTFNLFGKKPASHMFLSKL